MLHAFRVMEGVFEDRMDGHEGPFGIPALSQQFYETELKRGFVRGYTLLALRSFGPLDRASGGFSGQAVPWGTDHHRVMRRRFPHTVSVSIMGEDLPEEKNRVGLDPETKDSSGIPAPRVVYAYGENSSKILEHGGMMAWHVLEASGAVEILDSGQIHPAFHLMGTVRMGTDPNNSVVNAWHRAHSVTNLFIVDGSSFVTSAAVNPTSTIGALALRCADGIWGQRRKWTT
jgi:choline dehydrogenase-like flavoprotein